MSTARERVAAVVGAATAGPWYCEVPISVPRIRARREDGDLFVFESNACALHNETDGHAIALLRNLADAVFGEDGLWAAAEEIKGFRPDHGLKIPTPLGLAISGIESALTRLAAAAETEVPRD